MGTLESRIAALLLLLAPACGASGGPSGGDGPGLGAAPRGAQMRAGIASGDAHSCVNYADGSVWCWGRNRVSQAGAPASARVLRPRRVSAADGSAQISARADATCAVSGQGRVRCWGAFGTRWPAPQGARAQEPGAPALVPGLVEAEQVAVGAAHACARTRDGGVWCWGRNELGQLGVPDAEPGRPVQVPLPEAAIELVSGEALSCAAISGRRWFCWGRRPDEYHLFRVPGWGSDSDRPVQVPGLEGMAALRFAAGYACGITGAGALRCTGGGLPSEILGVSEIAIGADFGSGLAGCARVAQGQVECWGANGQGQAAVWGPGRLRRSVRVPELEGAVSLSMGPSHGCALLGDLRVQCWGANGEGQRGTGRFGESDVRPRPILGEAGGAPGSGPACVPSSAYGLGAVEIEEGRVRVCVWGPRDPSVDPGSAEPHRRCWGISLDGGILEPESESGGDEPREVSEPSGSTEARLLNPRLDRSDRASGSATALAGDPANPGDAAHPRARGEAAGAVPPAGRWECLSSRGRVGEGLRILLPDGSCHPIRVARPTELLAAGSAGAVEHALTEDGRWIVFARPDRRRGHPVEETGLVGPLSLETYELQSGRRVARFLLPGESILDPLGEPGGALRAIGGVVRFRGGALLDPLTGLERVPLEWLGPHRRVREGVWIFAGADGRVREVDLRSGEAIRTVEAGIERSEELRFVDAHRAVLATRSRIRLLDLDRGAILWSVSLPSCRGH